MYWWTTQISADAEALLRETVTLASGAKFNEKNYIAKELEKAAQSLRVELGDSLDGLVLAALQANNPPSTIVGITKALNSGGVWVLPCEVEESVARLDEKGLVEESICLVCAKEQ